MVVFSNTATRGLFKVGAVYELLSRSNTMPFQTIVRPAPRQGDQHEEEGQRFHGVDVVRMGQQGQRRSSEPSSHAGGGGTRADDRLAQSFGAHDYEPARAVPNKKFVRKRSKPTQG